MRNIRSAMHRFKNIFQGESSSSTKKNKLDDDFNLTQTSSDIQNVSTERNPTAIEEYFPHPKYDNLTVQEEQMYPAFSRLEISTKEIKIKPPNSDKEFNLKNIASQEYSRNNTTSKIITSDWPPSEELFPKSRSSLNETLPPLNEIIEQPIFVSDVNSTYTLNNSSTIVELDNLPRDTIFSVDANLSVTKLKNFLKYIKIVKIGKNTSSAAIQYILTLKVIDFCIDKDTTYNKLSDIYSSITNSYGYTEYFPKKVYIKGDISFDVFKILDRFKLRIVNIDYALSTSTINNLLKTNPQINTIIIGKDTPIEVISNLPQKLIIRISPYTPSKLIKAIPNGRYIAITKSAHIESLNFLSPETKLLIMPSVENVMLENIPQHFDKVFYFDTNLYVRFKEHLPKHIKPYKIKLI